MHQERRRHRSNDRAKAAHLFFSALKRRTQARSIVIADEDGLLVLGVGEGDLETLAALGPQAVPGQRFHGASFEWEGEKLRLYAVAGVRPQIGEAASAFSRIFSKA